MKKVVIIGGGFGGLTAITKLKPLIKKGFVQVTLIDENNFSLFTPMLPEVASGTVKPENIVFSLRKICKKNNVNFICDSVISVDKEQDTVSCSRTTLKYDYLIIASGSETNFRNNDTAINNCLEYKSIKDAIDLKYRIIDLLEEASFIEDKQQKQQLLSFSIIGGGITGVELACELSEFIKERIKNEYSNISFGDYKITIFEYSDNILPAIDKKQALKAQDIVKNKGINVITNANVKIIESDYLIYEVDGIEHKFTSLTTIWTAGVKGQSYLTSLNFQMTNDYRIFVDEHLIPKNFDKKNIFIIGDSSAFEFKNNILPPVAPLAMQQASIVIKNIYCLITGKTLKKFTYLNFGYLVALGKNNSVVNLFGIKLRGKFAYYLWKLIYLYKIGMIKKQIAVFFDWILSAMFGDEATLILNNEKCTGCNSCISKCPANILKKVNGKVIKTTPEECILCETCVSTCEQNVHKKIKKY
jgi:NADH dehydrogenase